MRSITLQKQIKTNYLPFTIAEIREQELEKEPSKNCLACYSTVIIMKNGRPFEMIQLLINLRIRNYDSIGCYCVSSTQSIKPPALLLARENSRISISERENPTKNIVSYISQNHTISGALSLNK